MELRKLAEIVEEKGGEVVNGNWFDIKPEQSVKDVVLVIQYNSHFGAELVHVTTTQEIYNLRDRQQGRFSVLAAYRIDLVELERDGRVRACLE